MKRINNAVLDNMLTTRFRTFRPVLLITLYNLMLLGLILLIRGFSSLTGVGTDTGMTLFVSLVVFQFLLIVFIMPALTAGLISGERERKTLDLLLCTQMSPLSVVLGKLFSGCLFMVLCVVCSLPMVTLAYLYGGVSVVNVLSIMGCYLVTIIAVGSLGVFFSSFMKKTTTAVVLTYLAVFFLGFASSVGGYVQMAIDAALHQNVNGYIPGYPTLWILNPAMALMELLGQSSPASQFGVLFALGGSGGTGQWPTMWYWELLALVLVAALLVVLSARILAPRRGWRTWKKSKPQGVNVNNA